MLGNDIEVRFGAEAAAFFQVLEQVQKRLGQATQDMQSELKAMSDNTKAITEGLAARLTSLFSFGAILGYVNQAKAAVTEAEASFRGLEAVANHAGIGIGKAMEAAGRVAADGLITTAEASKSLQNLLARGYSLQQAEDTLNRLKDAATYNRAAHLTMGEAVMTATEGLKNENSILVDNAGVTKNVSKMWADYAAQIGKGVNSLTQAEKIQAEYNGVMQETQAQLGNAAKASDTLQGKTAVLSAKMQDLMIMLGERLTPAFNLVAQGATWVIDKLNLFVRLIQISGAQIAKWGADVGAVFNAVRNLDFSNLRAQLKQNQAVLDDMVDSIMTAKAGTSFAPNPYSGKRKDDDKPTPEKKKGDDKKAKSDAERAAREAAEQARKLEALRVDAITETLMATVEAEQAAFNTRKQIQGVSLDEMLAKESEFETRRYEIQRAALEAEQAAAFKAKDPVQHAAVLNKIEALEHQHAANLQAIRDRVDIEAARRAQQVAMIRAAASISASNAEVDALEQSARQQLALHMITQEEFIALEEQFENRRTEIRRNALQERLLQVDPDNDPVQYAALKAQIEEIEIQHQAKLTEIKNSGELERAQYALGAINSIQGGMANVLQQVMMGQMTLAQGLRGIWVSVLSALTSEIAKFAAQWIAKKLAMLVFGKTTALSEITTNVAKAGAGGVASMAAAPWPLNMSAPAFGAAMAAAAAAFSPAVSAAGGYDIPAGLNPVAQLHAREMVLPAKYADMIRSVTGFGEKADPAWPAVFNFNIQTPDADSFQYSKAQIEADMGLAYERMVKRNM